MPSSPIIARADALMHRRRASDHEIDDIPVLTDSIDQIDDFPLLTEIEPPLEAEVFVNKAVDSVETVVTSPELEPEIPLAVSPEVPNILDPAMRDELVHEITKRIEERIMAALPGIISSTVSDFLAERDMIENR